MAICSSISVAIMVAINTIFALLGICITGISSYGLATLEQWKGLGLEQGAFIVGVIFGLAVFFISFMGCIGAIKQNKACLGIYMLFELIITVVLIAIAVGALVYGGSINRANTLIGRTTSNMVLDVYHTCCTRPVIGLTKLKYGSETNEKEYECDSSDPRGCKPPMCTVGYCSAQKLQVNQCQFEYCADDKGNEDCCSSQATDKLLTAMDGSASPLCVTISAALFQSSTSVEKEACTNGADDYAAKLMKFLIDNIQMFGIAIAVIASILLLLFVSSVALCCTHKDKFDPDATA